MVTCPPATARESACGHADHDGMGNIADVTLAPGATVTPGARRNFLTTSACGICGKTSIEDICVLPHASLAADTARFTPDMLAALPDRLRDAQRVFSRTGGLHAAGLFTAGGELIAVREDVGRHNAVDKVVGWALLSGRLPLAGCVLLVSGRASFELVQKAILAGIPLLAAVSAPSSLAVDLAEQAAHPGWLPARPVDERLHRSPPAYGLNVLNLDRPFPSMSGGYIGSCDQSGCLQAHSVCARRRLRLQDPARRTGRNGRQAHARRDRHRPDGGSRAR